jgi:hypothetical protein
MSNIISQANGSFQIPAAVVSNTLSGVHVKLEGSCHVRVQVNSEARWRNSGASNRDSLVKIAAVGFFVNNAIV